MADIEALLGALTLEEKVSLTAGGGLMSFSSVERLGIPTINVTDGPSGARGPSFPGMGPASTCIPCGSAIGATWDPELAEELGSLLGREALDRGCRGLLAPTVNLHRSPLAGRNFECYSEDPLLSGRLAAGFVRGVQAKGVFATVKHFVGNDAEFERSSMSSVIDDRTLRELYLLPFEIAVREGGALAVMTSYNRLNGKWLTEQRPLLVDLLREEWGFEGLVMTDWFAVVKTESALAAGLDVEMPGPGRALGQAVHAAVQDGRVAEKDLDEAVRRFLGALDRIGALDAPEPPFEPRPTSAANTALLRRAAADATVLLHNDGVLPIDPASIGKLAVIGPHAIAPRLVGGGSAAVAFHPHVNPLDALITALGDGVEVVFERGCEADRSPAVVGGTVLPAPGGFVVEAYDGPDHDSSLQLDATLDNLRAFALDLASDAGSGSRWSARIRGTIVPEESGRFELALAQAGEARVFLDGELVLDGVHHAPTGRSTEMFGMVSDDIVTEVGLVRGEPVEILVELTAGQSVISGFRLGFRSADVDALIERAVAAAADADAAVLFVGTTEEWETEGRDRPSFAVPGRQEELVRRVAEVSPRTVVVLNAGAPVDLSWVDDTAAALQCWFDGQEMGPAIADVLTGRAEPGGRLATTVPYRIEHNPSFDNFPGENGEVLYGERVFMGYRGYEHRAISPRFPFGHGLGYTTFELGQPTLSASRFKEGGSLTVSVPVTNTGERAGAEVVQCYIAPITCRLARPPKELKAFAKVRLAPGETAIVDLELEDRSFAYWDPGQPDWPEVAGFLDGMPGVNPAGNVERREPGWYVDPGTYDIVVGRSSEDVAARITIEVESATARDGA